MAIFLKVSRGHKKTVKMTENSSNADQPIKDSVSGQEIAEENGSTQTEKGEEIKEKHQDKHHKEPHKGKKDKNQERITELESAIVEMADRHLRLQAEFDNFRKRTLKEKAELIKSGGETVLTSILPVIDDLDRAIITMKDVSDEDPAKIGFLLIYNKFKEFLKQNNLKEIEATGSDFDVDMHFALTKIPAPTDELKGKVVDVIEKGYLLNDKVIRFAKVVIGE
jgi:molecular chaperone GrpE